MDEKYTLQLINEGKDIAYIIFRSTGTITADGEMQNNIFIVKLDVTNQQGHAQEAHIYPLT